MSATEASLKRKAVEKPPSAKPVSTSFSSSSSSAAPTVAKSKGGRRPPPLPPPSPEKAQPPAGRFDVIAIDNVRDILSYLDPAELVRFTRTCKANNHAEACPEWLWNQILYSPQVDPFSEYRLGLDASTRTALETHFGFRKVFTAMMSDRCSNCNKATQGFEVLSCSRACQNCWMCTDSGSNGLSSTSPFALCALGFASTHYLLSASEIKKELLVLEIDDPTLAHGLISSKMTIVHVNAVKELAEKKFGGAGGLAVEKTKRAEKSRSAWSKKCEEAKQTGASLPAFPECVRKEDQKETPQVGLTRNDACLICYSTLINYPFLHLVKALQLRHQESTQP